MSAHWSRRRLLRAGSVAVGAALAGCGGGAGGSGSSTDTTPDPDAGTDSYGILARNDLASAKEVTVTAGPLWASENSFERTVTLEAGGSREWSQVITEQKEYEVTASFGGGDGKFESDGLSLTPGSKGAPDVSNVRVVLERLDRDTVAVDVTTDPPEG